MLRLTNTTNGANKFWQAETKGSKLNTHWGRIGTAGQSKTILFSDAAKAKAALKQLISEKQRKGYVAGAAKNTKTAKPKKAGGSLISRLETWLSANRPAYLKQSKKGADAQAIQKLEESVGATLPAGFKAFLAWRNGQPESSWSALDDHRVFMPISQIRSAQRTLNGLLKAGDFERANWWSTKWVPFLAMNDTDFLVIDLEGTFTGKKGQVLDFWHDDPRRTVVHASFDAWLRTFVEALEAGLYRIERDDDDDDDDAELEIARPGELAKLTKKLNPGYPIKKKAG